MQLDYNSLLDNIKRRRYDEAIRDHVLSHSFSDENLSESVRYAFESMQEVDSAYAYKVYANTRKINEAIDKELSKQGISAVVRYQGALRTDTHVRLYGEVEMLFILEDKASHKDVFALGQIIRDTTSKLNLQSTDYNDGVHIRLVTQKPVCRINVIPCSWINNPQYAETRNEIYRGIAVYNFKEKTRKKHLPFLNMARVNSKDNATNGNYKKLIRLLRSICTDTSISLNAYELSGLIYGIPDESIIADHSTTLSILPALKTYVQEQLSDRDSFELLLSPSEKELVFGKSKDKMEMTRKLHDCLEALIENLRETLGSNLEKPVDYSLELPAHADSE